MQHLLVLFVVGGLLVLGCACNASAEGSEVPGDVLGDVPGGGEFIAPGAVETGGVGDWALIYAGGAHRMDWTSEQFGPYVVYVGPDGGQGKWLFDGFLFIEFKDARGQEYAKGYGQKPAAKEHWAWLLDRYFEEGKALHALDEKIGEVAAGVGEPIRKRRVAITLPEPIVTLDAWGEVDGKMLNFSKAEDRVAAAAWYLDELEKRWAAAGFEHIELVGIYWVAETTANEGEQVLPRVGELVRGHGWKFLWIPYWNARGAGDWKAMGFDAAYQQPNHFFHPGKVADERLDEAVAFGKAHDMGMEMEWDGRIISQPEDFLPRMHAYLDAFEKGGAMERAAMAHYEGGGGLLKLSEQTDAKLRAVYDRYCQGIVKRQTKLDEAADE